jgi:hypothetical protein
MTDIALTRQDAEAIIGGGKLPGWDGLSDVLACLRASRESEPPPMSAELLGQLSAEAGAEEER